MLKPFREERRAIIGFDVCSLLSGLASSFLDGGNGGGNASAALAGGPSSGGLQVVRDPRGTSRGDKEGDLASTRSAIKAKRQPGLHRL